MIPASQANSSNCVAINKAGVVANPKSNTSQPAASKTAIMAFFNSGPVKRLSCPIPILKGRGTPLLDNQLRMPFAIKRVSSIPKFLTLSSAVIAIPRMSEPFCNFVNSIDKFLLLTPIIFYADLPSNCVIPAF